ncbi:50S ribosomal protein L15 [candidate division WWE3 bacterium CG08_land_8_20_14_0_20_43_13]|uniref:Large ribosomal subunit protein uL15 n=1 Tax=candidate division WWE3 bacterium CG08_land_8_20_14_0_20_43_13 TaxID=1975087 RepID=A0A2H0X765_UNCKA|nr:MAG: 50S ribosomal protein L15 [candidate division WWE3 bacterium CG08_land_8_20_14_0_20_43_13]
MDLHFLSKLSGCSRKAKIVGRGFGSGKGGHTTGRGNKGQKARSRVKSWFEGGQKPFIHRLPFIGGFRRVSIPLVSISSRQLASFFKEGNLVNLESLRERGLVKNSFKGRIKIIGGELPKKLKFSREITFSASATPKKLGN